MQFKRLNLAIMLPLVALCSCTTEELEIGTGSSDEIVLGDNQIELSATVEEEYSTKGTPITEGDDVETLGIYTNVRTYNTDASISISTYLSNSEVKRNGYWTLEFVDITYWPVLKDNQALGFIAYSPYVDTVGNTTASTGLTNPESSSMLQFEIDYSVPEEVADQPDLLVSYPVRQTEGAVPLTFKHALATVVFNVIGDGVQPVDSIVITDIGYEGHMKVTFTENSSSSIDTTTNVITTTYSYEQESLVWTLAEKDATSTDELSDDTDSSDDEDDVTYKTRDMSLSVSAGSLVSVMPDDDLQQITSTTGALMMIPQSVVASSEIKIYFSDGESRSVRFLDDQSWVAGGLYNYNINIDFEGEVVDFCDITTVNTLVGNPDGTELETANCYILNPPIYTKEQEFPTTEEEDEEEDGGSSSVAAATRSGVFTRTGDSDSETTETIYGALYYIPITSQMAAFYDGTTYDSTYTSVPAHTNWTPEILWYDCKENPVSQGVIIKRVEARNGEECFSVYVPYGYENFGNVVIGVSCDAGPIIWSWHLWITDYNPYYDYNLGYDATATGATGAYSIAVEGGELHHYRDYEYANNYYWSSASYYRYRLMMDRNLGAWDSELSSYDNTDRTPGLFYQYGRKDPFPRVITATYTDANANLTYKNMALYYQTSTSTSTILNSIQYPLTTYGSSSYWCSTTSTEYTYVWNDNQIVATDTGKGTTAGEYYKSLFDPSPLGFMVPTYNIWTDFSTAYSPKSTGTTLSSSTTGMVYGCTDNGFEARYPDAAFLNASGVMTSAASSGCWTCKPYSTTSAYKLNFTTVAEGVASIATNTGTSAVRAYGYPVRPIQRWYGDVPTN